MRMKCSPGTKAPRTGVIVGRSGDDARGVAGAGAKPLVVREVELLCRRRGLLGGDGRGDGEKRVHCRWWCGAAASADACAGVRESAQEAEAGKQRTDSLPPPDDPVVLISLRKALKKRPVSGTAREGLQTGTYRVRDETIVQLRAEPRSR